MDSTDSWLRTVLLDGIVIPAHPLALTPDGALDEVHQRGLTRHYANVGAGGVAVGVHTTRFEIREMGVLHDVLWLAADELAQYHAATGRRLVKVSGAIGGTAQATAEAVTARELGYDAVLLSLGGSVWQSASESQLLDHCAEVAQILPLFGFYLQPAVGGRLLGESFWRRFAEIPELVAVKIAPFNRYQTLDVVRAIINANRADVALYTGNDDTILQDLLTPFRFRRDGDGVMVERWFSGGLLGQWAMWTEDAVRLLALVKECRRRGVVPLSLLSYGASLTWLNGQIFDAEGNFEGCIERINQVLIQDGLVADSATSS